MVIAMTAARERILFFTIDFELRRNFSFSGRFTPNARGLIAFLRRGVLQRKMDINDASTLPQPKNLSDVSF
jgi:hypothetical protein